MDKIVIFSNNVRKEREYQKLTLKKLSELSGYNRYDLSSFENGEHDILLDTAVKLAKALNKGFPDMLSRNYSVGKDSSYIDDDYLSIFSENLYKMIKKKNFLQTHFHATQKIEAPHVNKILKKKITPKLGTLLRLCDDFEEDAQFFFIREGGK